MKRVWTVLTAFLFLLSSVTVKVSAQGQTAEQVITGKPVSQEYYETDETYENDDTFELPVEVRYCQTEARSELAMVNAFRTGEDAWYWNSDDSEKVYVTGLSELQYDYELEKVAMQRAAEIAVYYSHTRPDDSRCWQTYSDLGYSYWSAAENIAAGYTSASSVFNAWKEDNYGYSGQGHRRNMLSKNYQAVGFGCVYYEGYYYWVQNFSNAVHSSTETDALDDYSVKTVKIKNDYASTWTMSTDTLDISSGENYNMADLIQISYQLSIYGWGVQNRSRKCMLVPDWQPEDTEIISCNSGVLRGLKGGSSKMTAITPDGGTTLTVTVNVTEVHHWAQPEYTWSDDLFSVTAQVKCTDCDVTVTETVNTVKEVIKAASCMEEGEVQYTAEFENELFETQEKIIILPATGHAYALTEWKWLNDFNEAYAIFTCEHDQTHVQEIKAEIQTEETDEYYIYTATASFEGTVYTDTKTVKKAVRPSGISLDESEITIVCNDTVQLNATVFPEDAEDQSVTWSSSDESIAIVNQNGLVTGKKVGKATITATTVNGISASCEVRVLFTDVADESRFFFNPVYWAVENNVTVGTSPDKFSPDAEVTRGQIVTFLYRAAGEPEISGDMPFTDVTEDRYFYNAVLWAAENGITTGTSATQFSPDKSCTRGQAVTFLYRAVAE